MPRFRLPRIDLASLRDRLRSDERLALVAQLAALVVVLGVVATFVLVAVHSGDEDSEAAKHPAIPTISDAGGPEPTVSKPQPTHEDTTIAMPTVTTTTTATPAEVVKPKPKPKPRPRPTGHPTRPVPLPRPTPPPPPDDGGVQTGVPYERCSPEGAKGVTKGHRIPLVCKDGRWHFVGIAR
jgi:hypothetical protein